MLNLIIYIAIFCHGTSLKTSSGHVGTRTCVAGLFQQTWYALHHQTYTKKDVSSQELSNTVFSHSMGKNSMMFLDKILLYI